MACFSSPDAAQALQLPATASIDRRNELVAFENERPEDSDEDNGTDAPIFDRFYDHGGAKAIVEMTNINPAQFIGIWAELEAFILANYNVGRGRKCAQKPKDVLFMVLAVLKHGGYVGYFGEDVWAENVCI